MSSPRNTNSELSDAAKGKILLIYQLKKELAAYVNSCLFGWPSHQVLSLSNELTHDLSFQQIYDILKKKEGSAPYSNLYCQILQEYLARIKELEPSISGEPPQDSINLSAEEKRVHLDSLIRRDETPRNLEIAKSLAADQTYHIYNAAYRGQWKIVTTLAASARNISSVHKNGALVLAAKANKTEAAMALIEADAVEKDSGLFSETYTHTEQPNLYLTYTHTEQPSLYLSKTALYYAAENKNLPLFTKLLEKGSDPHYQTSPECTFDPIPFKKAMEYAEDNKENGWNSILWLCQLRKELNEYADSWTARHSDRALNLIKNLPYGSPGDIAKVLKRALDAFDEKKPLSSSEKYAQKSVNGIKDRYYNIIEKYAAHVQTADISRTVPHTLAVTNPASAWLFFSRSSKSTADKRHSSIFTKRVSV